MKQIPRPYFPKAGKIYSALSKRGELSILETFCCRGNTNATRQTNFRIRLLTGCDGLEQDASHFRYRTQGRSSGDPNLQTMWSRSWEHRALYYELPFPRRGQEFCPWISPTPSLPTLTQPGTRPRRIQRCHTRNWLDWPQTYSTLYHRISISTQGCQNGHITFSTIGFYCCPSGLLSGIGNNKEEEAWHTHQMCWQST